MDFKTVTDIGLLVIGVVLSGLLGVLWRDIREVRDKMGNYVKTTDCIEKRGVCGTMREAMSSMVNTHGESLQTMQELLRTSTECLARLDERTIALKEQLKMVVDGINKSESDPLR
jgi:hypothetical protein